jgi:hypothetical protein
MLQYLSLLLRRNHNAEMVNQGNFTPVINHNQDELGAIINKLLQVEEYHKIIHFVPGYRELKSRLKLSRLYNIITEDYLQW